MELRGSRDQITQPPLQLGPARQNLGWIEEDRERVRDRAIFNDETPLHIDFAERKLRVQQNPAFGVGGQESHGDRLAGSIAADKFGPPRSRKPHPPPPNKLLQEITQPTSHPNPQTKPPL